MRVGFHNPDPFAVNVVNGANFFTIDAYHTSTINMSGGDRNSGNLSGHDNTNVNVSGGSLVGLYGYDKSHLSMTDGTVRGVGLFGSSTANVSGGSLGGIATHDNSVTAAKNITIDTGYITADGHSILNLNNVTVSNPYGEGLIWAYGNSTINISGGDSQKLYVQESGTVNISGGTFGTNKAYVAESGVLNLYGTSLSFNGANFTGQLLDGSDVSGVRFERVGGPNGTVNLFNGGNSQSIPLLPSSTSGTTNTFNNKPSGVWFDPPLVGSYDFAMTDGNRFTDILDFPSAIGDADNLFTVRVGQTTLGQFGPGQAVNFADFGFAGGVTDFTVSGIDPTVDGASPTAFPIKLGFSSSFASFTMTGITAAAPEPGTLALLLPFAAGVLVWRKRGVK